MKKELTLEIVQKIADEAENTIRNSINSYSDLGKPLTLMQLKRQFGGQHEWIAQLMTDLILCEPVSKAFLIPGMGNFETEVKVQAEPAQGQGDLSLSFKLQGKDEQQTKNIATSFVGGKIETEDGSIVVNKTDGKLDQKVAVAAEKLAQYFVTKYMKDHGGK